MDLAPIVLFVYNRPRHTQRTLEALQANELAGLSELFIVSDGPGSDADRGPVEAVRKYCRTAQGFKKITVRESCENRGLAKSISTGVTEMVNTYGKTIVLEDDLVTSPAFLSYMNEALSRYEHDEKVMHISGYTPPISPEGIRETFFFRAAFCWGWATWARAWRHYRRDPAGIAASFTLQMRRSFNLDGDYNFWSFIEENLSGKRTTWAIFWYAAVFLNHGLCLQPAKSLVRNIGHDGTGMHSNAETRFDVELDDRPVGYFETEVREDLEASLRIRRYFRDTAPSLMMRLRSRLSGLMRNMK